MEVQGGFIVGFDNDPASIFRKQIEFISKERHCYGNGRFTQCPARNPTLWTNEERGPLIVGFTGDNTDCSMNFVPKMKRETLIDGYQHILHTIYAPKAYYSELRLFSRNFTRIMSSEPTNSSGRMLWDFLNRCGYSAWWTKAETFLEIYFNRAGQNDRSSSRFRFILAAYGFHFRKVAAKIGKGYCTVPVEVENR